MASLLLLDLDNLLGQDLSRQLTHDERVDACLARLRPTGYRTTPPDLDCVVVAAMNTATARMLDLASVDRLAGSLARLILGGGARVQLVEVLLTLVAPEAADIALCAALRSASETQGAGDFGLAILVSSDGGIERWLVQELEAHPVRFGPIKYLRRGWTRGAPLAPIPSSGRVPAEAPQWWIPINTELLCADVASMAPQLPRTLPRELRSIAALVEEEPGLLTQLGPTSSSLAGAARLRASLLSTPGLSLACSPQDGLEIKTTGTPRGGRLNQARVKSSSLPVGAAVLCWYDRDILLERFVIRTRLPTSVIPHLAARSSQTVPSPSDWSDTHLLDVGSQAGFHPSSSRDFRFDSITWNGGHKLRCQVEHEDASQAPRAWWVHARPDRRPGASSTAGRLSATIKLIAEQAPFLPIDGSILASGQFVAEARSTPSELVVRSALRVGQEVSLQADCPPGQLAAARGPGGIPCCFLNAGPLTLRAGESVAVLVIQHLDVPALGALTGWAGAFCREILRLPVVLALDSVESVALPPLPERT